MTEPFDLLETHVRRVALAVRPTVSDERFAADIMAGGHRPDQPVRRRDGRRLFGIVAAVVGVSVVGSVAVAVFRGSPPEQPQADIVCRSAAAVGSSAIAVEPTGDPVGQCALLWREGSLPDIDRPGPGGTVPALVACTGEAGSIEVFPTPDGQTCGSFGMLDADVDAAFVDPVRELEELLVVRINGQPCASAELVRREAARTLVELGLTDWTVTVSSPGSPCGRVLVESELREVVVFDDPFAPADNPSD